MTSTSATDLAGLGLEVDYDLPEGTVETFRAQGWAPLPGLLSPQTVDAIFQRLQTSGHDVEPSETEKWMTADEYSKTLQMHDGMAWRDNWFRELALSPRLRHTALALLDAQDGLFIHDMSFTKPSHDGGPTPFHQDFPFWPFDRKGAFTIWIALTDMTEDMGTLQYLSGSQNEGPLGRFSRGPDDDIRNSYPQLSSRYSFDAGTALKAGDATVHGDLMVHGARGNSTTNTRSAYTLRYMPTDVIYTGSPHRHFDSFGLTAGQLFSDSTLVPRITW